MNKYTLHVALFDGDEATLKQQLANYHRDGIILNAYDDGDSFQEWGEHTDSAMRHGQVVFEATNDFAAEVEGLSILMYLLRHDNYLVSLRTSCSNKAHQPFAITDADNYERVIL